jgi:signal transduction histidine kinase
MATAEAAVEGPRWRAALACFGSAGVMVAYEFTDRFDGAFIWVLGIVLGLVSGIAIRSVIELLSELREAQEGLATNAAAQERQRIAREVHDVVAHSLAVTMLHVTGARMALRRDVDEAAEALEQAEQLGRQSLAEVRRIVGLLQPAGAGTAAPLPGAGDVPALVEQFRHAGLDVELHIDGDVDGVPASSGLAIYRIAQESLTNVVKHAPGTVADVRLAIDNGTVTLAVRNRQTSRAMTSPDVGSGMGVPGMRRRAESLGGVFRAGANGRGDAWYVEAALPTDGA